MKIEVPSVAQGNELDTFLYNRDNGENSAEKLILSIRAIEESSLKYSKKERKNYTNERDKFETFNDLLNSDLPIRIFGSRGRLGEYFLIVDVRNRLLIGGFNTAGTILNNRFNSDLTSLLFTEKESIDILENGKIFLRGMSADLFERPSDNLLEEIDYTKLDANNLKKLTIFNDKEIRAESGTFKKIDFANMLIQRSCRNFFAP